MKIENWPFTSNRNQLRIIMENEAKGKNEDDCLATSSNAGDGSDHLLWFKFNIDGISLYLFFNINTNIIIVISVQLFFENGVGMPLSLM